MNWNEYFKSVKEGRFENVYLFTGPEALMKREALSALRGAVLPPGLEQLNDATLEGCTAQSIIDSAETLPVMCEKRIVVVRDWPPLISGRAKNEENDVARMLEWLKNPPESTILVFFMTVDLDGRKKLSSTLKKMPGYVEFEHLAGATLAKWCAQQLKPLGKRINAGAVNELTEMAGADLNRLSGELKKLAAYVGDRNEIETEDVRAVVSPTPEYSVFMILDHLLSGKTAEAMAVMKSVLQTEPSAVRLILLIGNQLRIDAHMKYALERDGSADRAIKELGLNPYRARHILRQIRAIPADGLREKYLACVDADFAIRSGKVRERAALEALMFRIALPATKEKQVSSKR